MLPIHINKGEMFDEVNNTFINVEAVDLQLEHSLISISKWESRWKKPFLDEDAVKTKEELLDYIYCMSIDDNVDHNVIYFISDAEILKIQQYIETKQTASWITNLDDKPKRNSEQVTSELIYYWMIAYNIPSEYAKWHLSRLLTLVEICEAKNSPPKKMSREEILRRNKILNEQRKAKYNSRG